MKIVINPQYEYLRKFVGNLPRTFGTQGVVIHDARNIIRLITVQDTPLAVKSFKVPNLINRVIYSFIRPSKAKRAYEYSLRLIEKQINVPAPVAYIEERKLGLLKRSYFVYKYDDRVSHIREEMLGKAGGEEFETALARFIAHMHRQGVLHLDMSPGNILWRKQGEEYVFSVIDFNRMQFADDIPEEKRYKSFRRISEEPRIIMHIAREYAKVCGLNEDEAAKKIYNYCYEYSSEMKKKPKLRL